MVLLGGQAVTVLLVAVGIGASRLARTGPWVYGTAAAGVVLAAVFAVGGLG